GLETFPAEIRPGTLRDAVLYAVGANATHGLRRSNADKHHAVALLLVDRVWGAWSDREIARRTHTSAPFVAKMRSEVTVNVYSEERTYQNKYGRQTTMQTGRIGKAVAFDALEAIAPEVRETLRETSLADEPKELVRLARLPVERQAEVARRLLSGEARNVQAAVRQLAREGRRAQGLAEAIQGRFPVILADPPWQYENSRLNGAPDDHYRTLSTQELCAFPVSEVATTNAVLFLWVPNPLLEDALAVMRAWGFRYVTNIAWLKDKATYGKLASYVYGKHELLLIGVRGNHLPREGSLPESVLMAPKGVHSAKPVDVYALIEGMYGGPYLELFARRQRAGWKVFGDEVESKD
ncbi:MAG TPA: MT-A70 family methyltransferase, partial [Armatimonadota bacterium]